MLWNSLSGGCWKQFQHCTFRGTGTTVDTDRKSYIVLSIMFLFCLFVSLLNVDAWEGNKLATSV